MENLLYTTIPASLIRFITQQDKNYNITIDFKGCIKYINPHDQLLTHCVLRPIYVTHTKINPKYKIIKKNNNFCVVKVVIPSYTISFPQFHDLEYTFKKNSLNLIIKLVDFNIEYDDVVAFFDNGIKNYLIRTIDSILSRKFIGNNFYSISCEDYETEINITYNSLS